MTSPSPKPGEHEPDCVEPSRVHAPPGRKERTGEDDRGDANRNVDEEDPAPAERVDERAADERAERRGEGRRQHEHARGADTLGGCVRAIEERHSHRRLDPAAEPL